MMNPRRTVIYSRKEKATVIELKFLAVSGSYLIRITGTSREPYEYANCTAVRNSVMLTHNVQQRFTWLGFAAVFQLCAVPQGQVVYNSEVGEGEPDLVCCE